MPKTGEKEKVSTLTTDLFGEQRQRLDENELGIDLGRRPFSTFTYHGIDWVGDCGDDKSRKVEPDPEEEEVHSRMPVLLMLSSNTQAIRLPSPDPRATSVR